MNFDFELHDLCYTSEEGGTLCVLPSLRDGGAIGWLDDTHHRSYDVKKVLKDTSDLFSFEDVEGRKFTIRPLTLEAWKTVKKSFGELPDFKSEAEMRTFFMERMVL